MAVPGCSIPGSMVPVRAGAHGQDYSQGAARLHGARARGGSRLFPLCATFAVEWRRCARGRTISVSVIRLSSRWRPCAGGAPPPPLPRRSRPSTRPHCQRLGHDRVASRRGVVDDRAQDIGAKVGRGDLFVPTVGHVVHKKPGARLPPVEIVIVAIRALIISGVSLGRDMAVERHIERRSWATSAAAVRHTRARVSAISTCRRGSGPPALRSWGSGNAHQA